MNMIRCAVGALPWLGVVVETCGGNYREGAKSAEKKKKKKKKLTTEGTEGAEGGAEHSKGTGGIRRLRR